MVFVSVLRQDVVFFDGMSTGQLTNRLAVCIATYNIYRLPYITYILNRIEMTSSAVCFFNLIRVYQDKLIIREF